MDKFFGTDGIRAVAGEYPLDSPTIERIGFSLTKVLIARGNRTPVIIIGRDTRESGAWIEKAIYRGVAAGGGETKSAGVITTPGVAYLTRVLGANAGIVISASHNPYQDNGIKIFAPSGQKLDDEAERIIEADLRAPGSDNPPPAPLSHTEDHGLQERYLAFLRDEAVAGLRLDGLKIAIDCANGASSGLAPRLFSSLGATIRTIHADPSGRNINLDCGSLHPEHLQRIVVETGSDLGLAFDGDADRLLMVDERGELVDGDQYLYVMAAYLNARGKLPGNRVVATVMSNLGLEIGLAKLGATLVRTSVGDKNVLDELLKNGGSLGGEQSGHFIFPELSLAGDGMLSAIEILRVLRDSGRPLSDLAGGFVRYPQVTVNIRVSRKPPLDTIPRVKQVLDRVETELAGRGRVLVRYSGTENLVRVMVEGEAMPAIRAQAESVADAIREEIG
ncbi:MAG: phosphoglucosamine mutase [Blastocatellia bacterium]